MLEIQEVAKVTEQQVAAWNDATQAERTAWTIAVTPEERLALGIAITSNSWHNAKEKVALENPQLTADEVSVLYVQQKHGREVAKEFAVALQARKMAKTG